MRNCSLWYWCSLFHWVYIKNIELGFWLIISVRNFSMREEFMWHIPEEKSKTKWKNVIVLSRFRIFCWLYLHYFCWLQRKYHLNSKWGSGNIKGKMLYSLRISEKIFCYNDNAGMNSNKSSVSIEFSCWTSYPLIKLPQIILIRLKKLLHLLYELVIFWFCFLKKILFQ